MGKLLTSALEHDIEPELARKLLAAYAIRPGPEAMAISAWPWPLKIRALGPLQIQVDGRPLRFGRKTPTVPLAVLKVLVAAGEPVSVARLTTAVWPGYRGDAPRGTLDSALHRLRKLLGVAAAIESDGSRVGLAPESCWTDTRAFQLTCDRIGGLAKAAAHVPSVATVDGCERALLDLYRGPFGAEDDPPSVTRAREQLGRRFARAVADLEELWRRVGERDRRDRLVDLARARDDRVPMVATV
jgi:LuxR family transcriptional regulator, maltose regulon positive regulatory protein